MEFVWNEDKNKSNLNKHGISFEKAKEVFNDPGKIIYESEQDTGEKRFIISGEILDILYSVVYTIRETAIRIISARRANEKERKTYYNKKSS